VHAWSSLARQSVRYFRASLEVIRPAVPYPLRNLKDMLLERGIDISHERVRLVERVRPALCTRQFASR
jgi:transposase-like protein